MTNLKPLISFVAYCLRHPEQRFWQALRNWANVNFILVADRLHDETTIHDTFYWAGRNCNE